MPCEYPYASGSQTYFYTPYIGRRFLDDWKRQRDAVRRTLPPPIRSAIKYEGIQALNKLLKLVDGKCANIETLSYKERCRLAWLIDEERKQVTAFAKAAGVQI